MSGADASTSFDIQADADVFPTDISTLLSKWWWWSSLHLSAHCLDGHICLDLPIGYPMADLSSVQWGRHVVWGAARFRTGEKLPRQGWRSCGASNHGCASGKLSVRCALEFMPARCCRQARQMAMAADRSDVLALTVIGHRPFMLRDMKSILFSSHTLCTATVSMASKSWLAFVRSHLTDVMISSFLTPEWQSSNFLTCPFKSVLTIPF